MTILANADIARVTWDRIRTIRLEQHAQLANLRAISMDHAEGHNLGSRIHTNPMTILADQDKEGVTRNRIGGIRFQRHTQLANLQAIPMDCVH